jgi:hypothetical protein
MTPPSSDPDFVRNLEAPDIPEPSGERPFAVPAVFFDRPHLRGAKGSPMSDFEVVMARNSRPRQLASEQAGDDEQPKHRRSIDPDDREDYEQWRKERGRRGRKRRDKAGGRHQKGRERE